MTPYQYAKQLITGLADRNKQLLDEGWQGYFTTFMFNRICGGISQVNHEMQMQIEGTYASFLTRFNRRPDAHGAVHPKLIACPDWPVPKAKKRPLQEILINDGLHHHGILLIPPGPSRLKVSIDQHFTDNQSYYLRQRSLKRIDVRPFPNEDVYDVTDYAFKGLKSNRLPSDETLVMLPKSRLEISTRPYLTKSAPE